MFLLPPFQRGCSGPGLELWILAVQDGQGASLYLIRVQRVTPHSGQAAYMWMDLPVIPTVQARAVSPTLGFLSPENVIGLR